MYALTVIAYVLENETEAFLQKTMVCARATRSENGNLKWKAETESMMAKPRERIRCHSI